MCARPDQTKSRHVRGQSASFRPFYASYGSYTPSAGFSRAMPSIPRTFDCLDSEFPLFKTTRLTLERDASLGQDEGPTPHFHQETTRQALDFQRYLRRGLDLGKCFLYGDFDHAVSLREGPELFYDAVRDAILSDLGVDRSLNNLGKKLN